MKTYVTFGHGHRHVVNGKVFDRDCVAVIKSSSPAEGRARAFELFGPKFCWEYSEEEWNPAWDQYYPDGYVYVDSDGEDDYAD